jgi:hypothetical protein
VFGNCVCSPGTHSQMNDCDHEECVCVKCLTGPFGLLGEHDPLYDWCNSCNRLLQQSAVTAARAPPRLSLLLTLNLANTFNTAARLIWPPPSEDRALPLWYLSGTFDKYLLFSHDCLIVDTPRLGAAQATLILTAPTRRISS